MQAKFVPQKFNSLRKTSKHFENVKKRCTPFKALFAYVALCNA